VSFDTQRVTDLTFDSYGTLVDVETATEALAEYTDRTEDISTLWRNRSLQFAMVANFTDTYQPFYEMNRDALQYALEAYDVDVSTEQRDEILSVYHELEVFEDIRGSMERLAEAGYGLYVLSNGDPDMLSSLVEHAEIEDLVADTISADEIKTFKPHVDLYRHAASRIGTPTEGLAHVAAGWWDVPGARHAGMQGVWADRKDSPWPHYLEEPGLTIDTFHDLADALDA
jgi:2-haloacid dehalogenase